MASDSRVNLNHNSSQCSICHGDLKQLKFLDCHHTFCMKCIRDLDKRSPETISCPLCQRKARKEIAEKDFSWKTLYVEYDGNEVEAEFNKVKFVFKITNDRTVTQGTISAIAFKIIEPVDKSRDIDYDISLVSKKVPDRSVKRIGNCQLEGSDWFWIHFIQKSHAVDVENGFIVKERIDETGKKLQTFQLDVGIAVDFYKNTIKPTESFQTVIPKEDNLQISKEDRVRKTIYFDCVGDEIEVKVDGIEFDLYLTSVYDNYYYYHSSDCKYRHSDCNCTCHKDFYVHDLYIKITLKRTSHLKSCEINYDILLVNQKDREYSRGHTGICEVTKSDGSPLIHLSNTSDAFNKSEGFIVKDKRHRTFQLDVGMKVRNKK